MVGTTTPVGKRSISVEILHSAGCPHLGGVRARLSAAAEHDRGEALP
jgi:hypothetical protein